MEMKPPYHDHISDYDALRVQEIWEDSIELDVDIGDDDPFYARSNSAYNASIERAVGLIDVAKRKQHKFAKKDEAYSINRETFRSAPFSEQKVLVPIFRFESRMTRVHHEICSACNECSLNLTVNRNGICPRCADKRSSSNYTEDNAMIPIWIDDQGVERRDVPPELECLTIAEKLLIQRVSPLIPIHHIKNGKLGVKGHVCSFMQNSDELASSLQNYPRR